MSDFCVPQVEDNPDGWGPISGPAHLKNIPYAPFGKSETVGKAADWTQQNYQRGFNRYQPGQEHGGGFGFGLHEEAENFRLVDTRTAKAAIFNRKPKHSIQRNARGQENRNSFENQGRQRGSGQNYSQGQQNTHKRGNWGNPYFKKEPQKTVVYNSSIDIRPDWPLVIQIEFPALAKLRKSMGEAEDLYFCGSVEYYDRAYDRITPRNEKPLIKTRRVFRNVTTSDDPIMRKLASEDRGKIFMTDTIFTTLMCATRSVYSWDIFVTKVGDKLFFDKRDKGPLSYITVCETAPDQIPEEKDNINGLQQLSLEATMIKQNFSQQVLQKGSVYKFNHPNPFQDGHSELASCAYRYRKWKLSDNGNLDIIVRCEIDAVGEDQDGTKPQLLSIKALNEFSPKQGSGLDWRKRLESQRGAVFATELKNNMNKIAKWTVGAICAGVDAMKIGFVSRVQMKDPQRHVILGLQLCRPKEFADQISLKMDHCWGVLNYLVDLCIDRPDGKYIFVKDPNKPSLRLYDVSADSFDEQYGEDLHR